MLYSEEGKHIVWNSFTKIFLYQFVEIEPFQYLLESTQTGSISMKPWLRIFITGADCFNLLSIWSHSQQPNALLLRTIANIYGLPNWKLAIKLRRKRGFISENASHYYFNLLVKILWLVKNNEEMGERLIFYFYFFTSCLSSDLLPSSMTRIRNIIKWILPISSQLKLLKW